MTEYSDEQLVQDLVDRGTVTAQEQDIWATMEGYRPTEGFAMNLRYGLGTRMLQKYARKVRIKIIVHREDIKSGRVRFGHTLASGSRTRFAKDATPLGQLPGSSWNEERLKAAHAGSRRKVAKLPARRKRSA